MKELRTAVLVLIALFILSAPAESGFFVGIVDAFRDKISKMKETAYASELISVGEYLEGLAVTPDGQYIYVADDYNDKVYAVRAGDNAIAATIAVGSNPEQIAITPDGNYVYVSHSYGYNNTVSVIRVSDNTVVKTVIVGSAPKGLAVSPDGKYVYTANEFSDDVSIIRTSDNSVTSTIAVDSEPQALAFSPDGAYLYVTSTYRWPGRVDIVRVSDGTIAGTVTVGEEPTGIAVTPDGQYVYAANYYSENVSVIRTSDTSVIKTIPVGDYPRAAVAPSGRYAYIASCPEDYYSSYSGTLYIVSIPGNAVVKTISFSGSPKGIAVSPDGNYVYVSAYTYSRGHIAVIRTDGYK